MFSFRRSGIPLFIPLLMAAGVGYLLAGGAGSVVGALFFLPFLLFKMVAMFFIFGMMFRFVGWGNRWGPHGYHQRNSGPKTESDHKAEHAADPQATPKDDEDEKDWQEALRAAKREIDKLFPNPRE